MDELLLPFIYFMGLALVCGAFALAHIPILAFPNTHFSSCAQAS